MAGQILPWNVIASMLSERDQTKWPNKITAKQRKLIEDMADSEMETIVTNALFGL